MTETRPWWAVPVHPSHRKEHTDNATRFVKQLLEIHYSIQPHALHRFRWVASNAVHLRLLSALAPYRNDQIMVVGECDQLVGIAYRVDDKLEDGLYLEWVDAESYSIPATVEPGSTS